MSLLLSPREGSDFDVTCMFAAASGPLLTCHVSGDIVRWGLNDAVDPATEAIRGTVASLGAYSKAHASLSGHFEADCAFAADDAVYVASSSDKHHITVLDVTTGDLRQHCTARLHSGKIIHLAVIDAGSSEVSLHSLRQ